MSMSQTYRVNNLEEALELANKFKLEGVYNLFRGQPQNWEVISSLGRQTDDQYDEAKKKLERLYYFFQTEVSLKKYFVDVDWFYAVAQHYGIPTNYIDFSSSVNVAAYFATNSLDNKIGEECVIACLNEDDFNSLSDLGKAFYAKDNLLVPAIIKVDVDNLWRVQAQQGCFVFAPHGRIENFYDFDRILFPFEKSYTEIIEKEIYPQRKSELEINLDHYFSVERRLEGQKRLEQLVRDTKMPTTTLGPLKYDHLLLTKDAHRSWDIENTKVWNFSLSDNWKGLKETIRVDLKFDSDMEVNALLAEFCQLLEEWFKNNQIQRSTPLEFNISSNPNLEVELLKNINRSCTRIWDGTRNLPYTYHEVSMIISKYICVELHERIECDLTLFIENPVYLEICNHYGSISRLLPPQKNLFMLLERI